MWDSGKPWNQPARYPSAANRLGLLGRLLIKAQRNNRSTLQRRVSRWNQSVPGRLRNRTRKSHRVHCRPQGLQGLWNHVHAVGGSLGQPHVVNISFQNVVPSDRGKRITALCRILSGISGHHINGDKSAVEIAVCECTFYGRRSTFNERPHGNRTMFPHSPILHYHTVPVRFRNYPIHGSGFGANHLADRPSEQRGSQCCFTVKRVSIGYSLN